MKREILPKIVHGWKFHAWSCVQPNYPRKIYGAIKSCQSRNFHAWKLHFIHESFIFMRGNFIFSCMKVSFPCMKTAFSYTKISLSCVEISYFHAWKSHEIFTFFMNQTFSRGVLKDMRHCTLCRHDVSSPLVQPSTSLTFVAASLSLVSSQVPEVAS